HAGFIDVAADAGIDIEVTKTGTEPDTQPRSQDQADQPPQAEPEPATQAEPEPATQAEPGHTPHPASRSTALPFVHALGIDEHRRGKARFHWDIATKTWVADTDRWQSVFVDSAGGHGLLGQVEGRARADVTGWLAAQDPAWRAAVRYVTIDMSTVF